MQVFEPLDACKQLLHGKADHGMFCRMKPFVEQCIDWVGLFGQCIWIVIKKFFDDKQGAVGDAYWPGIQSCTNKAEYLLDLKNICYITERPGDFFFLIPPFLQWSLYGLFC